ncbi:MAG: hypothetical protein HUU01_05880 [Saprospiraceae bacterium]|nr:hypothetical protein [Saprospiraceae bacterium]
MRAGISYLGVLKQIDGLDEAAEAAFEAVIATYPPRTKTALHRLLELPEVLSLLTENIRLTILAGDLYRKDPAWIRHQVDSLNLVVARRNAQELEAWKQSLEDNPKVKAELMEAARTYADENGYQDNLYDDDLYDGDIYYEGQPERPVPIVERHYHHYPYWFGYPYWYDYPRWRPYPWWWEWGFYYPDRPYTIIVIGLPSYHFTHWYFYHPWHHNRWCHLSDHFVRHHNRHHDSGGSITAGVTVWQKQHRALISEAWLKDDGRRVERFREFGKFEAERDKYNRSNPDKTLNERDYLDRNANRYPELSKVKPLRPAFAPPATRPEGPVQEPRDKASNVPEKMPERDRVKIPAPEVKPKPDTRPKTKPETPPNRIPRTTIPEVDKGREHHEATLEKQKSKESAAPRQAPAPKMAPPVKTREMKEPVKREKSDGR